MKFKMLIVFCVVAFNTVACGKNNDKKQVEITSSPLIVGQTEVAPTQEKKQAEDALSLPGPIKYAQTDFQLAFSTRPSADYYKQEYLPANENIDKFNQLITVDVLMGVNVKDAIAGKIKELDARKSVDKLAHYEVYQNKTNGSFVLDFMLSERSSATSAVVEWNVYRYADYKDNKGNNGVLLFGLSKRGYDGGILEFVGDIKTNRKKYAADFLLLDLPHVVTH